MIFASGSLIVDYVIAWSLREKFEQGQLKNCNKYKNWYYTQAPMNEYRKHEAKRQPTISESNQCDQLIREMTNDSN